MDLNKSKQNIQNAHQDKTSVPSYLNGKHKPSVKIEVEITGKKLEVVVFTNGCFDLLHPGHLFLLKKAKQLGTKLIVGLDSDASVLSLNKRPRRPINNQIIRTEILKAIRWVDEVIVFDDLLSLVKELRPDIIVKGGDYPSKDKIVGANFVEGYGGKVVILPYLEGLSTTKLIHQIRGI